MICWSRVLVFFRQFFNLMTTALSFNHWLNLLASMRSLSIGCRLVSCKLLSALFMKTFSFCCSSVFQLLLEDRTVVPVTKPKSFFCHLCCCKPLRSLICWVVIGVEVVPLIGGGEGPYLRNSVSSFVHLLFLFKVPYPIESSRAVTQ